MNAQLPLKREAHGFLRRRCLMACQHLPREFYHCRLAVLSKSFIYQPRMRRGNASARIASVCAACLFGMQT